MGMAQGGPMTRDESIALAYKLSKEYDHLKRLEENITGLEKRVAVPADADIRQYHAFSYFTKPLVASLIVATALVIPGYMLASISNFLYKSGGDTIVFTPMMVFLFIAFIFALIHFIGGFYARAKCAEMNRIEKERVFSNLKLKKEQKKTIESLKEEYIEYSEYLEKYDSLIPPPARNKESMDRIRVMLMSGKAETFEEAVRIISE